MKKLSVLALAAVALAACDAQTPTPEDYQTINTEIQNATAPDQAISIVALGSNGDYVIALPANETITNIAAKKKTAKFLSIDNPAQYVAEGQCLLNIIPVNTMQMLGTPENTCNFRLFCGTADDINNSEFYAVELCSEPAGTSK